MKNKNITRTFLTLASCFVLVFIFCVEISAQKDVRKKKQTNTQKTKTETPKETPATTQKETPSATPKETPATNSNDGKKSIVVLDFYNVSPQCRDKTYGENIATQLTTAFDQTGQYTVEENQRIKEVFEKNKISQDELRDPKTAAKVGKALSANTVVFGTIRECVADTRVISLKLIGQAILHTVKVSLAIRLVDINTATVQDAIDISESETNRSGCIKGFCDKTIITPELQIKLFNSAVKKGVKKAVEKLSSIIEGRTTGNVTVKILDDEPIKPDSKTPIQQFSIPKVATIVGKTVWITGLGKDIKVGDLFSIIRGVEIKNPDTGEVIDFDGKEIAKVEVIEVRDNTIKAKIIKGTGVKEKDFVKPIN